VEIVKSRLRAVQSYHLIPFVAEHICQGLTRALIIVHNEDLFAWAAKITAWFLSPSIIAIRHEFTDATSRSMLPSNSRFTAFERPAAIRPAPR
jgi:hypothetical protein